jgi:curved DNA-binding protein CbpA
MSSPQPLFEDALLHAMETGFTGSVEGRQDKKRWVFSFQAGVLVGSKSNLKSEQPDAILAQRPDMGAEAVAKNVLLRRLKGALGGATEWSSAAGAPPAPVEPAELLPLLIKAVAGARELDALHAALGEDGTLELGNAALGTGPDAGLPAGHRSFLSGLGGQQLRAAAASGAIEERERLALLAAALRLGLLRRAAVRPAAPAPVAPAPAAATSLDIGALLSDVSPSRAPAAAPVPNPWAPDKVVKPAGEAGAAAAPIDLPPEGYEEAEIEAIGDGGPVRLDAAFFENINLRADREVVSLGAAAAPAAAEHPLAAELRELHARLLAAANHFEVLGLPYDVSVEDFRRAHLQLAQKLHPDRHNDASPEQQDMASEAFDKVRAAWEVLGDDKKRQEYVDRVIFGKKSEDELAMEQVQNYWSAESDFKRGVAAFNAGRMQEAHKMFEAAVARVPDELEFRAYLGFTTFQTYRARDPDKAEEGKEMLKEVLEKNKEQQRKLDGAWVLLGRIYRDIGNLDSAKRCFIQALKLNPSNPDATREMKRLSGGQPGGKKEEEKPGFFARLFGKK